nr:MAG TPA: hypothetical protein [Caudoviricetes sp.]
MKAEDRGANEDCKLCKHGVNCINGRYCLKIKQYVGHYTYSPCKVTRK